jgi:transposase
VVLPARAYKPRDKALVENAVRLVYMRVYALLKERLFTSLVGLNEAIWVLAEEHNTNSLKQGDSRRSIFEQEERKCLLPLPAIPYEIKRIREHKVMKNGHVTLHDDRHYYSVPHELIGKSVRLVYDSSKVDIFYMFKPVASHVRSYARNRYTTDPDHLAGKYRFLSEWNPEFFLGKARMISPEVEAFVEKLLESKQHPEQGYKACSGVLNLGRRVGDARITGACRRALEYGAYHYHILEEILRKGLDNETPEEQLAQATPRPPTHQNLRGKAYYQVNHLPTTKNDHHE